MDQLPDDLIIIVFSYTHDSRIFWPYSYYLRTIVNLRSVCRRFYHLELYLIKNLIIVAHGAAWAYRSYQKGVPFWRKYLPYIYHLDLCFYKSVKDVHMLTHLTSLDVYKGGVKDVSMLIQLRYLFCRKKLDVSKLIKTTIHYHMSSYKFGLVYNYYGICQQRKCIIRHPECV